MKKLILTSLVAACTVATPAIAQDAVIDPERKALLVSIIEGLGCKIDGAAPPKEFLDAMAKHEFVRTETKAIAAELVEEGLAERSGADLVLKTETCS